MEKKKAAAGSGTQPRKIIRTDKKSGKVYSYWEARATIGYELGTGKQIQKSFTGKTQAECRKKLVAALAEVDKGTYKAPSKITVGEWMETWMQEYNGSVKENTRATYRSAMDNHIIPALGAVKLDKLTPLQVQKFINGLTNKNTGKPLSPGSVKVIYTPLRKALGQAERCGIISRNPASEAELPKIKSKEIQPFDNGGMIAFMNAIEGSRLENLFTVALFTGMRRGELLGLTWDNVDFKSGIITISQQLQRLPGARAQYELITPKSGKSRSIAPASIVLEALKAEKLKQTENRLKAGITWANGLNLVFTDEVGKHLSCSVVRQNFKRYAEKAGRPDMVFHDLRHTFAVNALRSGDNAKSVSVALGHASTSFTLDVYASVTEEMQRESAAKMDAFVETLKRNRTAT